MTQQLSSHVFSPARKKAVAEKPVLNNNTSTQTNQFSTGTHHLRTGECSLMKRSTIQRFIQKIKINGLCWDWTAYKAKDGYGRFRFNGKKVLSHRFFYELVKGKIPTGLQLDHLCRNRGCVNPNHLEAVTQRENILRGIGPTAKNARKIHCCNGHLFDKKNTWIDKNWNRHCRKCATKNSSKYRQQKKHLEVIPFV